MMRNRAGGFFESTGTAWYLFFFHKMPKISSSSSGIQILSALDGSTSLKVVRGIRSSLTSQAMVKLSFPSPSPAGGVGSPTERLRAILMNVLLPFWVGPVTTIVTGFTLAIFPASMCCCEIVRLLKVCQVLGSGLKISGFWSIDFPNAGHQPCLSANAANERIGSWRKPRKVTTLSWGSLAECWPIDSRNMRWAEKPRHARLVEQFCHISRKRKLVFSHWISKASCEPQASTHYALILDTRRSKNNG